MTTEATGTTSAPKPLKLFYCYARVDKAYRDELDNHLSSLKRSHQIASWSDREISPGVEWETAIDKELNTAHIILLLVSSSFMASDYCYGIEMKRALERHKAGEARVVPILLRAVDWEDALFNHLQVLPSDAKPVSRWSDRDDAFEDIAKGLRKVVKELRTLLKTKEEWLKDRISGIGLDMLVLDAPLQEMKDTIHQLPWPAEVDVLIITVTNVELKAVLAHHPTRVRRRVREKTYYDLGYVGQARSIVVQANDMGLLEAHATVDEGIRALSPSAVIMTGIAFGVQTKGQQIGDVLVSKLIHDYDSERMGTSADDQLLIQHRGTRVKATGWLIDRFNAGSHDWLRPPEIHFGSILSGSKLVDNREYQNALLRSAPDAIGGEMEGVGLLKAAERHRVSWLLVKGISDWGNGTKGEDKGDNQQRAAENATRFVLFVIGQEDFMHKRRSGEG